MSNVKSTDVGLSSSNISNTYNELAHDAQTGGTSGMDDNGRSNKRAAALGDAKNPFGNDTTLKNDFRFKKIGAQLEPVIDESYFQDILRSHKIYDRDSINRYDNTYRFGLFDPYGAISTTREFLFFTKPDLHIIQRDDNTGAILNKLNSGLENLPYWRDLYNNHEDTIRMLESSYLGGPGTNKKDDPFNHLLQNMVMSNLEIPSLSSEMIDTPTNMYGVGYKYRGTSESSDDNPEFSLEFKDTRYLDTYLFFRTYEEYETLKHHGIIRPYKDYIINKVLHDGFAIFKFLVDEDMETIIYYGKMYNVVPKSLPRDVFSNATFDSGLSYTVDFSAAFYEDVRPEILADFNRLSKPYYDSLKYEIDVYNDVLNRVDNRAAKAAYIVKEKDTNFPGNVAYKLKWKGDEEY